MLKINFWDILLTIVNVLIIYWILKKFLFNRVLRVIKEREASIKDRYTEADNRKKEADKEKAKYLKKQSAAEEEASRIIKEARIEADKIHDKRIADAAEEADEIRAKARRDAENTKQRNLDESREAIGSLALMAAKKILENGDKYESGNGAQ
ncbi:MAG: ATP synthase F0 subunit B [Lachnospiraceae bacterium]|uniref:ATP synthase subunit b n=1 Tax=Candidatus Weimeria bifida TaxID=2599074 RepID=A0A6N7J378_9FIRM|nr:F0F1 ATP synthase subunit B [Candidatus Weimeria bifida]RRF96207.1 MAG: ATP synthase F0 subunit B [Lachnospiraceae bacterium]